MNIITMQVEGAHSADEVIDAVAAQFPRYRVSKDLGGGVVILELSLDRIAVSTTSTPRGWAVTADYGTRLTNKIFIFQFVLALLLFWRDMWLLGLLMCTAPLWAPPIRDLMMTSMVQEALGKAKKGLESADKLRTSSLSFPEITG